MNSDVMGDLHEPYLAEITGTLNSPGRKWLPEDCSCNRKSGHRDIGTSELRCSFNKFADSGPSDNHDEDVPMTRCPRCPDVPMSRCSDDPISRCAERKR